MEIKIRRETYIDPSVLDNLMYYKGSLQVLATNYAPAWPHAQSTQTAQIVLGRLF